MRNWICRKCGQEVMAIDSPSPIKWSDGHVCSFMEDHKYDQTNLEEVHHWDMVGFLPEPIKK